MATFTGKVSIKHKTSIITISLLVSVLIVTGLVATISARDGITRVAVRLLGQKANALQKYMTNQWQLLVENELSDSSEFRTTVEESIASYANSLIQSDTEVVFAIADSSEGYQLAVQVGAAEAIDTAIQDISVISDMIDNQQSSWVEFDTKYFDRVGQYFYFKPFSWHVFFTEDNKTFMKDANNISILTIIITISAVIIGFFLNIILIGYILKPINRTVDVMTRVITEGDLRASIKVETQDELGQLAQTFNVMISELNTMYSQIKNYALQAVYARRNETKVRNVFQKYVPASVIDAIIDRPESALVGANRKLTIMFTDIRNFTNIAEKSQPEKLVTALNKYFERLVDAIVDHKGMIDKYIGDAIMAVFGAPVVQRNSALAAIDAAITMQTTILEFNKEREKSGLPPFLTGMGIAHGLVTVGNIGTDKKMDYTVIGNTVNLCARLESLNKYYKQSVLFDQSVAQQAMKKYPIRFVDIVQVRGKTTGEHIYTIQASLNSKEKQAWEIHKKTVALYYKRNFSQALKGFEAVHELLPKDHISKLFIDRCKYYMKHEPPASWKGVEEVSS